MTENFPLGGWAYPALKELTIEHIDLWAGMGLTVTMSPRVDYPDKEGLEELKKWLDRAHEKGMKLIMFILGFGGLNVYEKQFTEVYEMYKGHPALYGFFVSDEPSDPGSVNFCCEIMKIQKRVAPELTPYINFTGGMSEMKDKLYPNKTFGEFIKEYMDKCGCDTFCYDSYAQSINDGGVTAHMKGLKAFADAADEAGVKWWLTPICSAHYAYRLPNEYLYMWQITTAAACGCKGITWFRLYDRKFLPNYYGSPIDEYFEPSEQYHMLKRCHKRFNDQYGKIMLTLNRKASYLIGFQRGDWEMFSDDMHDCITAVRSFENAIISFFEDKDGNEYLCFVNAEYKQIGSFTLNIDKSKCTLTELLKNGTLTNDIGERDRLNVTLYPGQMALYRINRK